MKTGRFKNFTKVCAKFLEVMFFTCSVVMIAATVYSFARGQEFVEFLAEQVGNGTIATNGFEISIQDAQGNCFVAAGRIFAIAGILTMFFIGMIFRNVYLIIKTWEGKTWFSKGETPFQGDVVRMVRECGIFSILVPVTGLLMSAVAKIVIGVDSCETSVQVVGIAMGLAMICFSRIFEYGISLEKEVEGLV